MNKSYHELFNEEGYIFMPKLFSGSELQRILDACNRLHARYDQEMERKHPGKDFVKFNHMMDSRWCGSPADEDRLLLMELAADPRILGPVEQIFEGKSLFRSATYWVNPKYHSEEGSWHRDSQFGRTPEEEKAYIASLQKDALLRGVQFQISFDSPEEFHIRLGDKGSHSRIPEGMPNALRFHLQPGDAIAFNQMGIHRGRYHTDKPRRTLMLTYTPANNPIFDKIGHQPWFLQDGYLDGLSPRAVTYYQEYIKVYKDHWTSFKQPTDLSTGR
jgi:hypothetical protein